jgi:hypothetical protein
MTSYRPDQTPTMNEIRVIERDGRRWLQQWRNKPGGYAYEYEWVDVAELPRQQGSVRPLGPR